MKVQIIRTCGTIEHIDIANKKNAMDEIRQAIGAPGALDTVNLRDGRVMLVDDTGAVTGKAVNPEATRHYWGVCRRGTTHRICGDVAIARDSDF
jgi:hypothetical protein